MAELPFITGGEARTASAAQSRFLDFVNNLLRLHLQCLQEAFITTVGDIMIDIRRVYVAAVAQIHSNLWLEHRQLEELGDSLQGTLATCAHGEVGTRIITSQPVPDNLSHKLRGYVAVEDSGLARLDYLD